jgi:hypothetical protein
MSSLNVNGCIRNSDGPETDDGGMSPFDFTQSLMHMLNSYLNIVGLN